VLAVHEAASDCCCCRLELVAPTLTTLMHGVDTWSMHHDAAAIGVLFRNLTSCAGGCIRL